MYTGGSQLIPTTDEALHNQGAWLSASEYDQQTRIRIDELWAEAATVPMWYALGASMQRQQPRETGARTATRSLEHSTITSIEGDTWELTDKQGIVDKVSKGNVLGALHRNANDIRWTSMAGERNTNHIERLVSTA